MKKRKLESFMLHDASAITKHLEKMAAKGWLLAHAANYFWTYEKIEPTALTFSVTYFSAVSDINPYSSENQSAFYEYCEALGWKLASEWNQMQIFYTENTKPIPIETDEALKLQTIHQSMRVQLFGLSFCLLIVMYQTVSLIINLIESPLSFFSRYSAY